MIKKLDILILILLPVVAVFASLALKANFFVSTILFYGLPGLYLSWRNPHAIKRALVFSLVLSFSGIVIDYLAVIDKAWYVPVTVFPVRLLGIIPIDDLIWGFFLVYAVVMFYEHFLDKGKHNAVDKKLKYVVYIILSMLVVFFTAYFFNPSLLQISHVYLKGALAVGLIPVLLFLSHFPRFLAKYMKVAIYFTAVNIVYELTALELGQWAFPGKNFIGWVEFGKYRFPFEEFFFFVIILSVAILAWFEYFDDNHLKREARRYT